MCVRIGKPPSVDIASLRENYISPELLEDQVVPDPVDQVCFFEVEKYIWYKILYAGYFPQILDFSLIFISNLLLV